MRSQPGKPGHAKPVPIEVHCDPQSRCVRVVNHGGPKRCAGGGVVRCGSFPPSATLGPNVRAGSDAPSYTLPYYAFFFEMPLFFVLPTAKSRDQHM